MAKKGVNSKPTKERLQELIDECDGIVRYVAPNLGVDERSVWRYVRQYNLYDYVKQTRKAKTDFYREALLDVAENNVEKLILDGDFSATKFYLLNHGVERGWGYKNNVQVDGSIAHTKLDDEQRKILLEKIANTHARRGTDSDKEGTT